MGSLGIWSLIVVLIFPLYFLFSRINRTYPDPPPEVEGLIRTIYHFIGRILIAK